MVLIAKPPNETDSPPETVVADAVPKTASPPPPKATVVETDSPPDDTMSEPEASVPDATPPDETISDPPPVWISALVSVPRTNSVPFWTFVPKPDAPADTKIFPAKRVTLLILPPDDTVIVPASI